MSAPRAIEFRIAFHIVPKARARVTIRGRGKVWAYHSERYGRSKKNLKNILTLEWAAQHHRRLAPPVRIDVLLGSYQSQQGDVDNILGAIADSLRDAGIISNDHQGVIEALSIGRWSGPETIINVTEIRDGHKA